MRRSWFPINRSLFRRSPQDPFRFYTTVKPSIPGDDTPTDTTDIPIDTTGLPPDIAEGVD
ncbi:MAG: hypothetical protein GX556_19165 [Fibrobacter sp.]|nr:hypothetical protein [Fibrobacter sp.]